MDYGVYDIDFTREGRRRVYLFSYLLSYSRRQYLRFVKSCGQYPPESRITHCLQRVFLHDTRRSVSLAQRFFRALSFRDADVRCRGVVKLVGAGLGANASTCARKRRKRCSSNRSDQRIQKPRCDRRPCTQPRSIQRCMDMGCIPSFLAKSSSHHSPRSS